MYLFDTDILSNLMKQSSSPLLRRQLCAVPADEQFTSSITLGELIHGARKKKSERLLKKIDQIIAHLPILPFDADAARKFGEVKADLERTGIPIGEADTRIASIALVHGMTVVTGNVKHFDRVPKLQVENWL